MARSSKRVLAFAAVGILAATTLGACGSSSDSSSAPATSMAASALAIPSTEALPEPIVGDDPATWAPVMVKKKTKKVAIIPRQIAVFPSYEYAKNGDFTAVSSDPMVIEILPADNSSVVGFRAVGAGTAVVKVYNGPVDGGGKMIKKVKVTVNPE